jgi:ribosomal protein S26
MIHYVVIAKGHIAFFAVYEEAIDFALDFCGTIYNMWAFTQKRKGLSYKTCPNCMGRHTKIIHLSAREDRAIKCQVCGAEYGFPE